MNRSGMFVAGVFIGAFLVQLGHGLYLHNTDYALSCFCTFVGGAIATGFAFIIGEEWK